MTGDPLRLVCPNCRTEVELPKGGSSDGDGAGEVPCGGCDQVYRVSDGIPDLTYPRDLLPSDQEFRDKYDTGAAEYDAGLDWLFTVFSEDANDVRGKMADLIELDRGARVLETGAGTGEDSAHILERIGSDGTLVATDISRGMLEVAREKLGEPGSLELCVCNAAALPYPDRSFDAAFHFGGINAFGDVKAALLEMDRVVRPGGKVVVGDEGIAPWLRRKLYGRILINANPLYRHRPPLEKLPESAREVRLQWMLGNAFYVIDYRVSESAPPMDLDLPIPGKGDSLRSRFYG